MWKKCTGLWREAHVEVSRGHKHRSFGALVCTLSSLSWRELISKSKFTKKTICTKNIFLGALLEVQNVEKVHAVVAWSAFASQKDHFGTLRCRKSASDCGAERSEVLHTDGGARRCGAEHRRTSESSKTDALWPLLVVENTVHAVA